METPLRPANLPPAPLSTLVAGLSMVGDTDSTVPVTGIGLDSRAISPGWLYVALPGRRAHGADFADAAIAGGAAAILTDDSGLRRLAGAKVPVVGAADARVAMAEVAARLFGRPAQTLTTLGVTGTNGKTTTVALLQSALLADQRTTGTIGTIGFRVGREELRTSRSTVTTPESPDLQALLAVMMQRGAEAVAIEVSSHALKLHRVDGLDFDVAGFLNLGRDHLDFHPDLEDYFESKAKLFGPGRAKTSVIWIDDDRGAQVAGRVAAHGQSRLITVGSGIAADYQLRHYEPVAPLGGRARVVRDDEEIELRISLPGRHNMIDAVVALAMAEAVGVPTDHALAGLAVAQVPGRMERVDLGADAPLAIVDFAHTPQAVAATLDSLAGLGRLVTVVGCGGDRDPDKRGPMGAAAASRSDLTIVTDDNPRTEDPAFIRSQVRAGAERACREGARVLEVPGRREAIESALRGARPGTVVAILGKGHERGQILADRVVDFDDVEEVRLAWLRRAEEGGHDAP